VPLDVVLQFLASRWELTVTQGVNYPLMALDA
jgi:hypothetical protein